MKKKSKKQKDPLDAKTRKLHRALSTLAAVSADDADWVVLKLLKALRTARPTFGFAVNYADVPPGTLLGITDDELYDLYCRAIDLFNDGFDEEALDLCQVIEVLSPDIPAVQLLEASVHLEQGEPEQALRLADAVLGVMQNETEAMLKKAQALCWMGRFEEAAELFQGLVDADPFLKKRETCEAREILGELMQLLGTEQIDGAEEL